MRQRRQFTEGETIGPYTLRQKPGHEGQQFVVPQGEGGTAVVYRVEQQLADRKVLRA